ncbi:hypothetical protein MAHJHV35_46990 [Mycobacterium avium subsp. hominissuis]
MPIAALTAMLHERGINLEILNFHQMRSATATATFIRGGNGAQRRACRIGRPAHRPLGARAEWAMGWSPDPTRSARSPLPPRMKVSVAVADRI